MNRNCSNNKDRYSEINESRDQNVWIYNIISIVDECDVFPSQRMTVNEKTNSITRLVLLIFIVMLATKYHYSLHFLTISLVVILILYYYSSINNNNNKEYYYKNNNTSMDEPRYSSKKLVGQNSKSKEKMSINPIIVPRSHDKDVWSFPSYRHSAVNYNNSEYDMSNDYTNIDQKESYEEFDPRMASYTSFDLDKMGKACSLDEYLPKQPKQPKQPDKINNSLLSNVTPISALIDTPPHPASIVPSRENFYHDNTQQRNQTKQKRIPLRENFYTNNTNNQTTSLSSIQEDEYQQYQQRQQPQERHQPQQGKQRHPYQHQEQQRRSNHEYFSQPTQATQSHEETKTIDNGGDFATIPIERGDEDYVPNQDLLIPRTISSIYGKGAVTNEERIKYLSNVQPNQYSYSDVTYPINSNIGISYTPTIPPKILDQVATPYGTHPLYHRIDPQLIRDDNIPFERQQELPRRTAWSAKYSGFEAAPGTVNFEDIYDPRFNGYGDEYRSYGDVNLGKIQYYYGDVDAYRSPNFGIRSKVDYIDYTDPMGRVIPEYDRKVGLNDIKKTVHDQFTADAMYFREGLQERLMRKRNSELWQLRAAPMRKDAHAGTFTSN
jgi:hypothetical protein